jgi:hypothetical protein
MDYGISKAFDHINRKRLKNLFCVYIKDIRFWFEISKLLDTGALFELQVILEHIGVATVVFLVLFYSTYTCMN